MNRTIVLILGIAGILSIVVCGVLAYVGKPVPEGLVAGGVTGVLSGLVGALQGNEKAYDTEKKDGM